jgi:hypothetical protein
MACLVRLLKPSPRAAEMALSAWRFGVVGHMQLPGPAVRNDRRKIGELR